MERATGDNGLPSRVLTWLLIAVACLIPLLLISLLVVPSRERGVSVFGVTLLVAAGAILVAIQGIQMAVSGRAPAQPKFLRRRGSFSAPPMTAPAVRLLGSSSVLAAIGLLLAETNQWDVGIRVPYPWAVASLVLGLIAAASGLLYWSWSRRG